MANAALSAARKVPVTEAPAEELAAIVNANLTGGRSCWAKAPFADCLLSCVTLQSPCCPHLFAGATACAVTPPLSCTCATGALLAAHAALPRMAPGGKFFLVDGSGRRAPPGRRPMGCARAACAPRRTCPGRVSKEPRAPESCQCCTFTPSTAHAPWPPPPGCSNGRPTAGNAAYGATKRALVQLKDSLAAEVRGSGVGVHIFSPGALHLVHARGSTHCLPPVAAALAAPAAGHPLLAEDGGAAHGHSLLPRQA